MTLFRCAVLAALISVPLSVRSQDALIHAATLQRNGLWEVGITFNPSVDTGSAQNPADYSVPGLEIAGFRFEPLSQAAVVALSNLVADAQYGLTITNLVDIHGNPLAPANAAFATRDFSWASVGANELGYAIDAISVNTNGFDLISGASQMANRYDEATFVYQHAPGDFDVKVRVSSQEAAGPDARAGLMVRESLDEGKGRPSNPFDTEQAFSRYLFLAVNPAAAADGQPGSNAHELVVRPFTGGIGSPNFNATEFVPIQNGAAPAYTNAWLRLTRTGQTFTAYRGTNGVDWVKLADYAFPATDVNGDAVAPFASDVLVGPAYSADNGDIIVSSGAQRAFLAEFRDYSATISPGNPNPPELKIVKNGNQIEVSWDTGTLENAPTIGQNNVWVTIPNVRSPYIIQPPFEAMRFYRVVH